MGAWVYAWDAVFVGWAFVESIVTVTVVGGSFSLKSSAFRSCGFAGTFGEFFRA